MNQQTITFVVPPEFEGMSGVTMRRALQEIDGELSDIAERKKNLLSQRKLIETVMYIIFPNEALNDGYQEMNKVVLARLRRAKELLAGDGKTKKEEYRRLGEEVDILEEEQRRLKPNIKIVPRPKI